MYYLHPEDGGNTFLQNVCNHLQDHTVSQPRRSQSTELILGISGKWCRSNAGIFNGRI
jgi:hypothetical protein